LDPKLRIQADLVNPNGHPSYKYFYYEESQVIAGMNAALEHFRSPIGESLFVTDEL
jgi:hypothetical protein